MPVVRNEARVDLRARAAPGLGASKLKFRPTTGFRVQGSGFRVLGLRFWV